jgi:phosphatidylserine/phosphatidylglycerophosphate/cardiolipin synthase-like enzyme
MGMFGEKGPKLIQSIPFFQRENVSFLESTMVFHSKFVIIDNNYAWITSCNLMSSQFINSSPEELVCELREGTIISELMEYVRNFIRKGRPELKWFDKVEDFPRDSLIQYEKKRKQLSDFTDLLRNLTEKTLKLYDHYKKQELIDELKEIYELVNKNLFDIRKEQTAVFIENLEHRKFLRACLGASKDNIKIGTDRIMKKALTSVLIKAMNECLDAGNKISINWGRTNPKNLSNDEKLFYSKIISEFNQETENRIKIDLLPSFSHAKYLTMDNTLALVTSYNLLAFAGEGKSEEDISLELGVILSDKNVIELISQK